MAQGGHGHHARGHHAHDHGGHDHHGRGHAHGHGGHAHAHGHRRAAGPDGERRLLLVMLLTGVFMLAEVVGGVLSGSLALIADAGHMLTDFASLALAWAAFRLSRRPADPRRSYGWHRAEVLAAFVNGVALVALAAWILLEAALRLSEPAEVLAGPMLAVAAAGLLVNLAAFWVLSRGEAGNLNLRGALAHVLGDLLGSAAAIGAAAVILWTGWTPIDPILSAAVALLILRTGWRIARDSGHILLEGTPEDVDPARVGLAVGGVPGVTDVHHVHAWSLTGERRVMTLHAVVEEGADQNETLRAIRALLSERFGIDHATVQLERGACVEARPDPAPSPARPRPGGDMRG